MLEWALIAPLAFGAQAQQPEIRLQEHVDVERVLVDVRVVDPRGEPVRGLNPSHFRVRVDGRVVDVESVRWIAANRAYAEGVTPEQARAMGASAVPEGRSVVFLFQRDFEPSRRVGLMRMQDEALKLIGSLQAADRVAVLAYDRRLKMLLDLTRDREAAGRVLRTAVYAPELRETGRREQPSLAEYLDPDAARRAATLEKALLVAADALAELPGPKTLVLFGWGLGRFVAGDRVLFDDEYGEAMRQMAASRTSVFALDVTDADFHSLEVGLMQVAADTGGFYARTHLFPDQALARVRNALSGHYVLAFVRPEGPAGAHELQIDLVGQEGDVMARPFYEDR